MTITAVAGTGAVVITTDLIVGVTTTVAMIMMDPAGITTGMTATMIAIMITTTITVAS
jgi:hypothetical protein